MPLDEKTTTELEAAAFRRLLEHLRARTDVQNIDLMNLAGFCRNCLSNWMKEAADARGVAMSKDESRETIYGMPYEEWKAKHQKEAAKDQQAAFEKTGHRHEILSPVYSVDEPSAGLTLVSLLLKPLATIRLSHWRRFPWPLPPLQRKKKRPLPASQRIT